MFLRAHITNITKIQKNDHVSDFSLAPSTEVLSVNSVIQNYHFEMGRHKKVLRNTTSILKLSIFIILGKFSSMQDCLFQAWTEFFTQGSIF